MSSFPRRVEFHEEGPREGFQMEKASYPQADRLALIDALAASGLKQVQCASFVSPRAVPQMADAPELFARLRKCPDTRYTAQWLNENGFERARACEQVDLDGKIVFYVTEPFSQRNNNCSVAQNRERQLAWIDRYIALGIPLEQAYVVTAFGCNLGGPVPVTAVTFDSSVAGPGGCPFAGHKDGSASGNVCTEDMVFMCEEMGIDTGIDLEKLVEASRLAERVIGRPLNGHLMHSGTLAAMRA